MYRESPAAVGFAVAKVGGGGSSGSPTSGGSNPTNTGSGGSSPTQNAAPRTKAVGGAVVGLVGAVLGAFML